MNPIIDVKNLTWKYDQDVILSNIGFQIPKGSFTGIIGPNGSGKTTLLRTLSSSLKPFKNTVFVGGKDILDYSARKLAQQMAFVPQNTHMDFEFTALDVVVMGRNPHLGRFEEESDKDLEIARKAMELTGTLSFQDRQITALSGGERQRVIIARAIAQQAEIILLDEPISHLDIRHQVDILNLIRSLVEQHGRTVVMVLHDLNLAAHYCEQLILLKQGCIYQQGTPQEVLLPEMVEDVYGIKVMSVHPYDSGTPYIIPRLQL